MLKMQPVARAKISIVAKHFDQTLAFYRLLASTSPRSRRSPGTSAREGCLNVL
jgi:hypothetical protein